MTFDELNERAYVLKVHVCILFIDCQEQIGTLLYKFDHFQFEIIAAVEQALSVFGFKHVNQQFGYFLNAFSFVYVCLSCQAVVVNEFDAVEQEIFNKFVVRIQEMLFVQMIFIGHKRFEFLIALFVIQIEQIT